MRLWFDEDLSPTLVQVAQELGFEATCNRDRGVLGISDRQLRERAQAEEFVLVTDNASDFRPLLARDAVHPGLIVLPGEYGRASQQRFAHQVIAHVAAEAAAAGEPPADYMVNRVVEIDDHGAISARQLPPT